MRGAGPSRRDWLVLIVFGLIGQIAWSVENMYFNLFVFDEVAPNLDAITLMVQLSGVVATLATLVAGTLSDKAGKRRRFISIGYIIWGVTVMLFGFITPKTVGEILGLTGDGAVFAALTSILAKVGISGVESNLGTAIRTAVVLLLAWGIVFARKKHKGLATLDRRELLFIVLSGIATGASWLAYYYALGNGEVRVVVPIDKMSILVTVAFSYVVFKEKLSKKAAVGLALMTVGTLMMALFT